MSVGPRHLAVLAAAGALAASIVAAPASGRPRPPEPPAEDRAYYVLPPGNYGGLPDHRRVARPAPAVRRAHAAARRRHRRRHRAHYLPEDFTPIGATARGAHRSSRHDDPLRRVRRPAHLRRDPGRRGLRRRLGDRPRPGPAAPARPGAGPGGGRRRPGHRRVLPGDERAVVRPQRGDRAARHRPGRPDHRDLRRQGPPDHRRRPGRAPTASTPTGQAHGIDQPPATVNDVIATTAFIGSIFGAGGGAEASTPSCWRRCSRGSAPRRDAGVGGRHAVRRPRGAHHDQAALRLRAADRRHGHRFGRRRPGLDRIARPPPADAGRTVAEPRVDAERRRRPRRPTRRPGRCPTGRRRTSSSSTRRGRRPATRSR